MSATQHAASMMWPDISSVTLITSGVAHSHFLLPSFGDPLMSPAFRVRPLRIADLPAVFQVRVATWHNDDGAAELNALGITIESTTRLLQTTHQGWVCEVGEQIVGFVMGNCKTGEMWVVAVLPELEGSGMGRQLLQRVEGWLFETWSEIWLTTDTDENFRAVGFYRHLGWQDWKLADGDRYMKKVRPVVRETRASVRPH
ncbi:MAG: GNAT family N-acetyltransferase [Planctomycetaceae bacterium]|nr:GNAT family N-acetyltransferase [Planctomycetaceae bacterium]